MQYPTKPSTNGRNRPRGRLGPLETVTRALRRNWILPVVIPILVIGFTAIALRFIQPVYEASAQLRIDQQRSNLAVLDALQSISSGSQIETEMMVLRSRTLAESVVDSLPHLALTLGGVGQLDGAGRVIESEEPTLVRVHRGLASFEGAARFSSWAYRILANVANERYRSRERQRPTVPVDALATEPEEAVDRPDPVGRLEARRLAAVVLEYFATLPPGQREVIELVDHEGMRPIEVAEALDMNPVTVRAHLFRARRAIRSRILERYPELTEGYER